MQLIIHTKKRRISCQDLTKQVLKEKEQKQAWVWEIARHPNRRINRQILDYLEDGEAPEEKVEVSGSGEEAPEQVRNKMLMMDWRNMPLHESPIVIKSQNRMMHVAVPVKEGCLSHSFDLSHSYEDTLCFDVFHVMKDKIIEEITIVDLSMDFKKFEEWCINNKITDVIGFKIGKDVIKILNKNKINVFLGVKQKSPKMLVRELIDGTLITNSKVIEM